MADIPAPEGRACDHYYLPKHDPKLDPEMWLSRCKKCGYERWTHVDQIEEWQRHGLGGRQIMRELEREQEHPNDH